MNYLLKPRPKKSKELRRGFVIVLILALLLALLSLAGSSAAYAMFGTIAKPFWLAEQHIESSISDMLVLFQTKQALQNENATLQRELANTASLQLQNNALLTENDSLKALQDEPSRVNAQASEIARVLSSPAQSFYDIFSVQLNPNSKVQTGDRVYGPHAVALGTVSERSGTLARITLFSSAGMVTDVELQKDGSHIQVTGQGDGSFVGVLPRSLVIMPGDAVVLPSFNNAVIGEVGTIEPAREDSFQNVYIRFPFNVTALSWVSIVI